MQGALSPPGGNKGGEKALSRDFDALSDSSLGHLSGGSWPYGTATYASIGSSGPGANRKALAGICAAVSPYAKTFFRKSSETMPSSIPSTLVYSSRSS